MPETETSHLHRSSIPRSGPALGGIGTGALEIRADGIFRNWTIFNNAPLFAAEPPQDREEERLFFFVRWQVADGRPKFRLLQVRTDAPHTAGATLQPYTFRWLRPIESITMTSRWPLAELTFCDGEMPFEVRLTTFSPFIPGQVKDSSLPGIYFDFEIRSQSDLPVEVLLVATLRHTVAYNVPDRLYGGGLASGQGWKGFTFTADEVPEEEATAGTMTLAHLSGGELSYHVGWSHQHVFHEPLIFAKQLSGKCEVEGQNAVRNHDGRRVATHPCFGSLGSRVRLTPGQEESVRLAMAWHFPNAYADQTRQAKKLGLTAETRIEGHAYTRHFSDSGAVIDYLATNAGSLGSRSREFVRHFFASSLPKSVLATVNSQFNTFVTSCWHTAAGDFGIQEGVTREQPWGPLATVDVGMYGSIGTLLLFPELDRAMWEVHHRLQSPDGEVSHGIGRNFARNDASGEAVHSRLDLVPQYVVQTIRHAFYTSDIEALRTFWPSIEKALEYVTTRRDADGDGLPEMSGSNSSYDNFPMFGPSSYVASQWISALDHARCAARVLGLDATGWDELRDRACKAFEARLWNGSYFSLYNDTGGSKGDRDEGCLTDQLIGQWANDLCDLGPICDPVRKESAFDAIMQRNFLPDEGLFNCRWPGDDWLHPVPDSVWYDQSNTFWTGVQLGFASLMALEGRPAAAIRIIEAVDRIQRAEGWLWDHFEWGGHYYRAMSALALPNSFLGLSWRMGVARFQPFSNVPYEGVFFLAGGYGTARRHRTASGEETLLHVIEGSCVIRGIAVAGAGSLRACHLGNPLVLQSDEEGEQGWWLREPITLVPGESLLITAESIRSAGNESPGDPSKTSRASG